MPQDTPSDYIFKFLLVGSTGVGKSAIRQRFINNEFSAAHITTIGIDFGIRTIDHKGEKIKLQIWDSAGEERFRSVTTAYYKSCNPIFLCFDLTSEKSFNEVLLWLHNIKNKTDQSIFLVGTKSDAGKRVVTAKEAQAYAKEHGFARYVEVSAKEDINIEKLFLDATDFALDLTKQNSQDNPQSGVTEQQKMLIQTISSELFKYANKVDGKYGGKEVTDPQGKTFRLPSGIYQMWKASKRYQHGELLQHWRQILERALERGEGNIWKRLPETQTFYKNTLTAINTKFPLEEKKDVITPGCCSFAAS
jgi:small GTP-binding protein